jgi:hypothetical protein
MRGNFTKSQSNWRLNFGGKMLSFGSSSQELSLYVRPPAGYIFPVFVNHLLTGCNILYCLVGLWISNVQQVRVCSNTSSGSTSSNSNPCCSNYDTINEVQYLPFQACPQRRPIEKFSGKFVLPGFSTCSQPTR